MRGNVRLVLSLIVAAWAVLSPMSRALAQDGRSGKPAAKVAAAAAPAKPIDPRKMEWLLEQWAGQSTKLKSLDVKIERTDSSPAWGDPERFEGRALFKAPGLAWIDFRKIDPKLPTKTVADERIICTGTEVWQYKAPLQEIFIFPLDNNAQKKALAQGPLPFLFNFRSEDAKQRYEMKLHSELKDSYIILITPLLEVDRDGFSKAFVQLDRKYLLPIRVTLFAPNGKDSKDFKLSAIKPNEVVSDQNFKGQVLPPPWKVIRNLDGNAPPAAPRAGVPARQPAASRPVNAAPRR